MAQVFISYSRKDKNLVRQLNDALIAQKREAWVDWKDIPLTAEWQQEIFNNIERADNFVFVISPDSVTSANCNREIEHAVASHKKILPIFYRSVQDAAIPESLGKFQRIEFSESDHFDEKFATLIAALDTDLEWVQAHTRLLTRANEWEREGKESSFLLRGKDLSEAEQMVAKAADREPKPTALQSEYILASRQSATYTQRIIIGAVAVAFLIAMGLAIYAFLKRNEAQRQTKEAQTQRHRAVARMLATEAASVLDNANARMDLGTRQLHAVLLGVESLKEEATPQGTEVVHRALSIMPTPLQTFDVDEGSRIDVSERGHVLTATLPSGDIRVWDVTTGRALLTVSEPVDSRPEIAISGDGRILARSRWNETARANERPRVILTEVTTGRELANIDLPLPPLNIALSPDGAQLAMADRKRIQLFDARRATLIATLAPQRGNASTGGFSQSLKFDSTGQHVEVLWGGMVEMLPTKAGDGTRTAHALAKLEDDSRILSAVSGDGRRVAAGDATGTIQVWDTETLIEVSRVEHGDSYIQAVALSTSGGWLAGVSRRGKLTVWLLPDGRVQTMIAGPPHWRSDVDHHVTLTGDGSARVAVSQDWVSVDSVVVGGSTLRLPIPGSSAVAANRDGSRIAVSDAYDFARIYNMHSGQEIARVVTPAEDFGGIVDALALSGDGSRLAVGGDFEIVRVFDVSTGRPLLKLGGKRGPAERKTAFALDDAGSCLAAVSPEATLTISSLDGTRPLTTRDLASPVRRLAFGRDRKYLVLDGLDSTIRVLDATSLEERARIPHQLNVAAVALTDDNTRVRVALHDGSVRQSVWRPQDVISQACSVIGRNFSRSEWPRYFPDEPFRPICDK